MTRIFALFFLALTSLAFSSVLVKLTNAPAEIVGFWRLLFSALILFSWQSMKDFNKYKNLPVKTILLIILSAFFFFAHLWTYFTGMHKTKIANGMIIFSINPLFTALGAMIFFKEKVTPKLLISYLLAFCGVYILVREQIDLKQPSEGEWTLLLSAVLISAYILASKKLRQTIPSTVYSSLLFFFTAVFFGLSGLMEGLDFTHYSAANWLVIAGFVFIPTLMGHNLFIYLFNHFPANVLSLGKLFEPIIATVAAFFIFNESIGTTTAVSFLLTAASVCVLFYKKPNPT